MSLIQGVLRVAVDVTIASGASIDGLDLRVLANEWGQLLISHELNQVSIHLSTIANANEEHSMLVALQLLTTWLWALHLY